MGFGEMNVTEEFLTALAEFILQKKVKMNNLLLV